MLEESLIERLGHAMERAPWATCRLTGAWMGLAFHAGSRNRRAIAQANLRLAMPHLSRARAGRIALRSAQNFGMSFCEFLHLRTASAREIHDYSEWRGLEHIEDGLAQGRGVMLTTAHFGAWEVMGARAAQEFPLTVVVRLTSNKALQAHVRRVRAEIHVGMILKSESPRASLKVLRANEGLAIFPDQHAGEEGALLEMFGLPTRSFTSPSRLALAARAPIVPTFAVRRTPWMADGRVVITASPGKYLHREEHEDREEAILEGTRYILQETEAIVRRHPEQWLWMHRRWRPEDTLAPVAPEPSTLA